MKTVCAKHGCPELVDDQDNRGYCDKHANEALIDAMEVLAGRIDENTQYLSVIYTKLDELAT